jgi:[ribosomal protein S18]-alanine N-acetyltransferase
VNETFVSEAVLADVRELHAIECASFPEPWSERSLTEFIVNRERSFCLTAREKDSPDAKILGYVGFQYVLDEGEIANLAVDPEYRGRGVGYALLEALVRECHRRGIGLIHLEVRPSNTAALTLYRKCAFEEDGRRRGYYADTGEDALLMSRRVL